MKKLLFAIIVLSALMMTACSKSEFIMSENTEKAMTIKAENANVDDFFMIGTLTVGEGEQITITSNLEKGAVKVELIGVPENQSIDEVPDLEIEPTYTDTVEVGSASLVGDYMVKATVTEKATGTIDINVIPAE